MVNQERITIKTSGRGLINITDQITPVVEKGQVASHGLCHLFIHHTSASLIICENFDPQVQADLEAFMNRLVPDGDPLFKHIEEGPDDMPSHVRSVLTASFLTIPITAGKLVLGRWQGIYLWEHRHRHYDRTITVTTLLD